MKPEARLKDRSAHVCIIGLGYVGLPLALSAAEAGFRVTGLDVSDERVRDVCSGHGKLTDLDDADLKQQIDAGRLSATTDMSTLATADVAIICVPTPLKDDLPDMSHVVAATEAIAASLHEGELVVLESTTYPGTTEELMAGILGASGLKPGEDFFLGFSPERIDPGNEAFDLSNVPKVIGGITERSTKLMAAFYGALVEQVIEVSSPRTAEMVKLLENTYRHVNIALINELAILAHELDIDIWEVVDAAGTKPFGFQKFYPGPGWGGHCIPVDPSYLSWRVRQVGGTARFVELAREINKRMPGYVVQRVTDALNDVGRSLRGSAILVIGVAYKRDVADLRETSAIPIIDRLAKAGASVSYTDPFIPSIDTERSVLTAVPLTKTALISSDLVLIHTDHSEYDWEWVADHSRLVLDTRHVFKDQAERIVRL